MSGWNISIKWEIILYFIAVSAATAVASYVAWVYYADGLMHGYMWSVFIFGVLLMGTITGYIVAQNIGRKLSVLQLSILQLARGNFAGRIAYLKSDRFAPIYHDFNEMAESVEDKIKLLQTLGEQSILDDNPSLEDAVLEERKRLARDLHDTVSQQLFAIHLSASSLPKLLEKDETAGKVVVNQLIQMSHHSQKQMRALIAQLRPLELDGQTLQTALDKWFPDYCRQNGLQGILDYQFQRNLSEAKEHQFFLIVQEAMANITKHAMATHVTLTMYETANQYIVTVEDDGIGFERALVKLSSYGLSTMRERAQKLGGSLEVLSKAGSGTRVKAIVPKFG